jgi:hypothetical protein
MFTACIFLDAKLSASGEEIKLCMNRFTKSILVEVDCAEALSNNRDTWHQFVHHVRELKGCLSSTEKFH